MKKAVFMIILIVLLPIYTISYVIAHILRVPEHDDMPTIREWLDVDQYD